MNALAPSLAQHFEAIVLERRLRIGRGLADRLGLAEGCRVLELGCATGLLSAFLSELVGPDGEVVGLDPMALRVQIAHQRGRHNQRFQVGDVYQLARFPAGSFDAVIANGSLHAWPDPARALAECARVLTAEGWLGLACESSAFAHPAEAAMLEVLAQAPYAAHPRPAEARDYKVDAPRLEALLRDAGLGPLPVQSQREVVLHANARAAIEHMQASAWGRFLDHLPASLRDAAQAEIIARLEAQRGPEGIRHEAVRLSAVVRKHAAGPP